MDIIKEIDLGLNVTYNLNEWLQITKLNIDLGSQIIQGVSRRVIKSVTGVPIIILNETSFRRLNDINTIAEETTVYTDINLMIDAYFTTPILINQ